MCHWVAKQFSRAISRSSSVGKTMAAMYHGSVADPGIGRWMCWSLLSLPILSFSWHPFPVLSFREAATLNPAMGSGKVCRLSLRAGQSPVAKRFWCILSQKIGCSSLTNSTIKYFPKITWLALLRCFSRVKIAVCQWGCILLFAALWIRHCNGVHKQTGNKFRPQYLP